MIDFHTIISHYTFHRLLPPYTIIPYILLFFCSIISTLYSYSALYYYLGFDSIYIYMIWVTSVYQGL